MKRKLIAALVILAVAVSLGAAKKNDEIKRMGIFISNFTELGMYEFDLEEDGYDEILHLGDPYSMPELIRFGIGHNIINNKKLIGKCTRKNCEFGSSTIAKESVAASVRKYFDLPVKHQKIMGDAPEVDYDGKLYHFDKRDWDNDTIYYADVQYVDRGKNFITMEGELYELDNPKHRPATFVAKAKPYRWNNKDTWSILALSVEWQE
ncbi:MAG: hypothetical protein IJP53_03335 [Synergistaceae bacterium]|nr:hypothetical protein [Synergistaceae bacterium]MBR0095273.1 hypothetical protein [Synergistaceae bacterium]